MRIRNSILLYLIFTLFLVSLTNVSADEQTIEITKDTYVSLGGALGDITANFGAANSLSVGEGFNGVTASIIQFNLPEVEYESITFSASIIAFGEETRKIKIDIISGIDWDELEITGEETTIDFFDLWQNSASEANYSISVGGSTDEISLDLASHDDMSGIVNIVLTPEITTSSWITMNSRESNDILEKPTLTIFGDNVTEEVGIQFLPVITISALVMANLIVKRTKI